MANFELIYIGDLRCKAVHLKSGSGIITDAPTDNMGKGEAFSPTDLTAASLGVCMLTTVGISAQKNNYSIDGARAEVTKIMAANPRRIAEIVVDLYFPANSYTENQKKMIETAALHCPVAKSLHPDLMQTVKFVW
jgi:putative redox protein